MRQDVAEEREKIRTEESKLDADLEAIDALLLPCVEDVDDEDPTLVRKIAAELRLRLAPGSSRRP